MSTVTINHRRCFTDKKENHLDIVITSDKCFVLGITMRSAAKGATPKYPENTKLENIRQKIQKSTAPLVRGTGS